MKRRNLERQRERIVELIEADPSRSARSIAMEVGCSTHTVIRQRDLRVQSHGENGTGEDVQSCSRPNAGRLNLVSPAGPGNDRATKHGVDSEIRLAPLRVEGERWARGRWPWLDDARVALVADLMARTELARRWIEAQGTVVRNKAGEVYPVVDRLERWSARLDDLIGRLDRETAERDKVNPIAELAAIAAEVEAEAS